LHSSVSLLAFPAHLLSLRQKPAVDPNAALYRFPDERLGTHYALNYALNHYGITPLGEHAYRNLHARHLAMLVDAQADKAKALHVHATQDDAAAATTTLTEGLEGAPHHTHSPPSPLPHLCLLCQVRR